MITDSYYSTQIDEVKWTEDLNIATDGKITGVLRLVDNGNYFDVSINTVAIREENGKEEDDNPDEGDDNNDEEGGEEDIQDNDNENQDDKNDDVNDNIKTGESSVEYIYLVTLLLSVFVIYISIKIRGRLVIK